MPSLQDRHKGAKFSPQPVTETTSANLHHLTLIFQNRRSTSNRAGGRSPPFNSRAPDRSG